MPQTKGRSLLSGRKKLILREYVRKYEGSYLEIGCYDGVTLAEISSATNKMCYGIDPFLGDEHVSPSTDHVTPLVEQKQNLYSNIHGKGNIKFFETTTEMFDKSLTDTDLRKMNISVCLIDGAHSTQFVNIDWKLSVRAIGSKTGVIVFDDVHVPDVVDSIGELLGFLETNEYKYSVLHGLVPPPIDTASHAERASALGDFITIEVNT
jgi:hypothetical protein